MAWNDRLGKECDLVYIHHRECPRSLRRRVTRSGHVIDSSGMKRDDCKAIFNEDLNNLYEK